MLINWAQHSAHLQTVRAMVHFRTNGEKIMSMETEIIEAVNNELGECPVITLVSGRRLIVREVMMHDARQLQAINGMKGEAARLLQGFSTGIGFWGSPAWVIEGSILLGTFESIVSNSRQRKGMSILRKAIEYFERLQPKFAPVDAINNLHKPDPKAWSAKMKNGGPKDTLYIHNGEEFVVVKTAEGVVSIRWSQVVSYVPPAKRLNATSQIDHEPVEFKKFAKGTEVIAKAPQAESGAFRAFVAAGFVLVLLMIFFAAHH